MKNQPQSQSKPDGQSNGLTPEELGGGNLDKVRDILFGTQMRDSDRRFQRLEERLAHDTTELKEEVRKRLSMLEQFVKQELESLADRISSEQQERTDSTKDLSREVREMSKAFEKKAGQLEDHTGKVQRELRQQLLEQQSSLREEIQKRVDEILVRLSRDSAEIRSDKLDRTMLSTMLTEMAMRLTNELSLPKVGGERA
jgi:DNA anti-recombination protein RmuC